MNNKKVIEVLVFFSILFLGLIIYLTTINIYYKDEYVESSYNQRNTVQEAKIKRGTIYDRNGTVLAYSEADEDMKQKRIYPHGSLYSHVIGYSSSRYGKSLVEKQYNQDLLGKNNVKSLFGTLFQNTIKDGDDITLTIDHKLQKRAAQLMKKYKGALVAMNPKSGEILAMISMPDFDPSEDALSENWAELNSAEDSPFLTRATMGMYPPGSTYKIITSAIILENNLADKVIKDDKGSIHLGDKDISNANGSIYGDTSLSKGFVKSSNVYFAAMGADIESSLHRDMAERFLLNEKIPFKFPIARSKFETSNMQPLPCAIASIGQGKTLMTPMHLALVASAVANNGVMPKPFIVSKVTDGNTVISRTAASTAAQPISAEIAEELKELMLETVNSGTGTAARIPGIKVCGKTGTAENEMTTYDENKTHALFVGFAPYDNPEIAVSVILENAGYGGSVAAPIAREVMKAYFSGK